MQDVVPHKAKAMARSQGFDENTTEEDARRFLANAVTTAERTLAPPDEEPETIESDSAASTNNQGQGCL